MIKGSLAKRYARALMEIGREKGIYERLGKEVSELVAAAEHDQWTQAAFRPAVLSKDMRAKLIEELSAGLGFHDITRRFLALLNQKGRLHRLPEIALAYQELADELEGRVRAEVTAAAELSEEGRDKVQKALSAITGKQVIMEITVDESLIGGVVARVAGNLLDGSVKTQLMAVEESLKA